MPESAKLFSRRYCGFCRFGLAASIANESSCLCGGRFINDGRGWTGVGRLFAANAAVESARLDYNAAKSAAIAANAAERVARRALAAANAAYFVAYAAEYAAS